jgi:hypothetical protein
MIGLIDDPDLLLAMDDQIQYEAREGYLPFIDDDKFEFTEYDWLLPLGNEPEELWRYHHHTVTITYGVAFSELLQGEEAERAKQGWKLFDFLTDRSR